VIRYASNLEVGRSYKIRKLGVNRKSYANGEKVKIPYLSAFVVYGIQLYKRKPSRVATAAGWLTLDLYLGVASASASCRHYQGPV
jgi:hypothetical protein